MHSERQHRVFSPSQADRFFLCPGSVNLLKRTPPRPTSIFALEGTKAHEVLEAGLRHGSKNATDAIDNSNHCLDTFDYEFMGAINDALDYVWDTMEELDMLYGDPQLFVETEVKVPVTSAPGEADGHSDIAIYSRAGRILYVIDYKHGVGVAKAVKGNRQVMQYGAGFLYGGTTEIKPEDVDTIVLVIIQPRAFHPEGDIREYRVTPLELADYLIDLDTAINACQQDNAPLTPGEDQCRFCDARSTCPALERFNMQTVNVHFAAVKDLAQSKMTDPKDLDVVRLSQIKQRLPMLKTWMDDIERHVNELVLGGKLVPGYKAVEPHPRRKYHGTELDIVRKLAPLIGCEEYELYRNTLIPLTEAEERIVTAFKQRVSKGRKNQAAEEARQMFAFFTTKESTGNLVVVEESDPRPSASKAATTFRNVNGLIQPPTQGETR